MAQRVRGTARERSTISITVFAGCALPIVANLPLFQGVVWVFWLAAFALIVSALVLVLRIIWRERDSSES